MSRQVRLLVLLGTLLLSVAPGRTDEKADALVKKLREKAGPAKSLQADVAMITEFDGKKETTCGTLRLLKPRYGELKTTTMDGKPHRRTIYDGTSVFAIDEQKKQYTERPAPTIARVMFAILGLPVTTFLDPDVLSRGAEVRYVGPETIEDRKYEVVEITYPGIPTRIKGYLGPSGLMEGVHSPFGTLGRMGTLTVWLKNVRLDTPLKPSEFAFKPPAGYTLRK